LLLNSHSAYNLLQSPSFEFYAHQQNPSAPPLTGGDHLLIESNPLLAQNHQFLSDHIVGHPLPVPQQSNGNLSGTNFGGIPQKSSKQGGQKGVLQKCPQQPKAANTVGGMPRGQPRKGGRRPRENEVKYF
jgi:hypothetical protein